MATTLTLSAGGETIDFIGGTDFRLLDAGLSIPSPESVRVTGGDPILRDGQQLIQRRYENRAISINFKAVSTTHDVLSAAFSRLQRILDYAVRAERSGGMLVGATLTLKLEDLTDTVTFDVLDGDVEIGAPLTVLTRRQGPILNNTVTLMARPYARGTVVRLENHLINSDFEINERGNGQDFDRWVEYAAGERHFRSNMVGLVPPGEIEFLTGSWCRDRVGTGGEKVIIKGGNAYELVWNPLEGKFVFRVAGPPQELIKLQTTKYTGDGQNGRFLLWEAPTSDDIPKVLVIGADDFNDGEPVIKTDFMGASSVNAQSMNDATTNADWIGQFETIGVRISGTITGNASVNKDTAENYSWALGGNGVVTGKYDGDGAATQKVITQNAGFAAIAPEMVWIIPDQQDDLPVIFTHKEVPVDEALSFADDLAFTDVIKTLNADGFTVGDATVNSVTNAYNKSGRTYYFVAFVKTSTMHLGSYVGDGADPRDLPANEMAFDPGLVAIKGDITATTNGGAWRTNHMVGDASHPMQKEALVADHIQVLNSEDGKFEVGANNGVNSSGGEDYYFFAFAGAPVNEFIEVKSAITYPDSEDHHVLGGALKYESNGTDVRQIYLMVDGEVVGVTKHSEKFLRDVTGQLGLGAEAANTRNFGGKLSGHLLLLRNVWPWEARLLYQYGLDSLKRGELGGVLGTPPGSDAWDIPLEEWGYLYTFPAGALTDQGPNALALSSDGTPDVTEVNAPKPDGWTQGSGMVGDPNSKIVRGDAQFGIRHFRIKRATGTSTFFIEHQILIPEELRGIDWYVTFYAKAFTVGETFLNIFTNLASGFPVNRQETTIPLTWTQYGRKFAVGANDTFVTLRFGYHSGASPTDVGVCGIQCAPNNPFNLAGGGATDAIAQLSPRVPFITSRFCRALPGSTGKDSRVAVYDLPGDSPLPTRTLIKSP